jgi:hypothetical protein
MEAANNENKGKSPAESDGTSWQEWLFKAKAFFTRHDVLEFMFIEGPEVEGRRFIEGTAMAKQQRLLCWSTTFVSSMDERSSSGGCGHDFFIAFAKDHTIGYSTANIFCILYRIYSQISRGNICSIHV